MVYGTYQSYLKSTPQTLATHLAAAHREGFTLGVKLVRGAYLASDPRHLINDTKEQTDEAFDSLSEGLIKRSYSKILQPVNNRTAIPFPSVNLILATHNRASIRKAQALIAATAQEGPTTRTSDIAYAQLMGMADEVSCELLQATPGNDSATNPERLPRAYKYLAWGTVGECMKYLLRRAEENRDALERTREGRDELARELWRRVKGLPFRRELSSNGS
jgi:proline dehydrogenase